MQTIKEKDNQMVNLKEQLSSLLEELKQKEHRITDLEFELLSVNNSSVALSLNSEKKDVDDEKNSFWMEQIEDKDREIERLEGELRKRTCDLQGIVNKELWAKNREIEKLQNRFGIVIENKDGEIAKLEQQLQLLKDKITEVGAQTPSDVTNTTQEREYFMGQIEMFQQKLQNIEQIELAELQIEQKHLQEELEKSEKIRAETNEVCICLSKRLEELALFLDSLLQKKSVLGFLGWKQNTHIKQFVNHSLELSKTLSITISQNPNQSLMEISNISALLTSTQNISVNVAELLEENDDNAASFALIPSDATLTYKSHLHKTKTDDSIVEEQNKIIKVLREQIQNLKHEIELRDIELNKIALNPADHVRNDEQLVNVLLDITSQKKRVLSPKSKSSSAKNKNETHSESESWSEPDRTVSLARIGLDDDSLKPVQTTSRRSRFLTSVSTESTEDEMSRTLTRTPSKKSLLAENRQTIISLHGEVCDLGRKLKETETELLKTREDLNTEKATKQRQLDELLQKIAAIEESLAVAEKRKHEAEKLLKTSEKTINAMQTEKAELQAQLIYKDKVMLNKINELEIEKCKAEQLAETAKIDLANSEIKLKNTKRELENIEVTVRKECGEQQKVYCDAIKEEFETKMQNIELRAKNEIEQAQSALKQLQNVLCTDYVQKCELEKQTRHLEHVLKELEETKAALCAAEMKLNEMEHQEADLKQKLRDIESKQWAKINDLHKELDSVNLQYSEAVLEKTKLNNEKTSLQHKLKSVDAKETELMLQAAEFQKEVSEMKETFQKQIAVMENKKSKLENRISELESINAELKNKLILLQTGINEQFLSTSLPVNPNKLHEMYLQKNYRRQFSDNSGYTSEDQPLEVIAQAAPEDMDRQNANSSPDLGIESDHGRFSSLEANIPRPLLQTLELTESMSNLLDAESQVQISNCSKCFNAFNYFICS